MDQETIPGSRRRSAGVTDDAIERIGDLVASGEWGPGTRLPREADLASSSASRATRWEAVRALSLARVLEVRQGDGTYVSSLEPGELLEPTLSATHLLQGRTVLELFEVRRMLEPEAAAMAAQRADAGVIAALRQSASTRSSARLPAATIRSSSSADDRARAARPRHRAHRRALRAVSDEEAKAVVERAWELGIRSFDTAPYYGSGLAERRLGNALRGRPRDELVVSTKVGRLLRPGDPGWHGAPPLEAYFDFSYDAALRSLDESLERLGLDRVDIALVHDPDDHYEEALVGAFRALERLRDEGVVRAIGVGIKRTEPLRPTGGRSRLLSRRRPVYRARPRGRRRAAAALPGARDHRDRGRGLQQRRAHGREHVRLRAGKP